MRYFILFSALFLSVLFVSCTKEIDTTPPVYSYVSSAPKIPYNLISKATAFAKKNNLSFWYIGDSLFFRRDTFAVMPTDIVKYKENFADSIAYVIVYGVYVEPYKAPIEYNRNTNTQAWLDAYYYGYSYMPSYGGGYNRPPTFVMPSANPFSIETLYLEMVGGMTHERGRLKHEYNPGNAYMFPVW